MCRALAARSYIYLLSARSVFRTGHEAPGFAVSFEVAVRVVGVGIEAGTFAKADGSDGNDVPDVFGDDVGDKEIDFGGGVNFAAGSGGFDAVAGFKVSAGGFYLDAKEAVAESDNRVVALAVSPRQADAEAEVRGAGQEGDR